MEYYEYAQIKEPSEQYPMGIWSGDMVTVTFEDALIGDHHGRVATPQQWALDRGKVYPIDHIPYYMDRMFNGYQCWSKSPGNHLIVSPGNREYLVIPCTRFPQGLKIGDIIKSGGGYNGVIIGGEEWVADGRDTIYRRPYNLDQSLYYKRKKEDRENGHSCWMSDMDVCRFIERPIPQETDGQLLMF